MSEPTYQRLAEIIGAIRDDKFQLDLNERELSCIAALYVNQFRSDGGTIISLEQISNAFELTCAIHHYPVDNLAKSVTSLVDKFRKQKILLLMDGSNYYAKPEYALSPLGSVLGAFVSETRNIRLESFVSITDAIIATLNEVLQVARSSSAAEVWSKQVIDPLDSVIRELLHAIDLRQKTLDEQHEKTKSRIAEVIKQDWFNAIQECEELLENITNTLEDLEKVVSKATQVMENLLHDIEERARELEFLEIVESIYRAEIQVQQLYLWGHSRYHSWSKYFQRMQGYIREIVRTDPQRRLSANLHKQIATWLDDPFYLIVADDEYMLVPKSLDLPDSFDRKKVSAVPSKVQEQDHEAADRKAAEEAELRHKVDTALREKPSWLSEICDEVCASYSPSEHYALLGKIAALVHPRIVKKQAYRYRWSRLASGHEIEDWEILEILND